ncbi:MAG: alpha/beta hydrolase family protein [Caulobacteraceae bacterium]
MQNRAPYLGALIAFLLLAACAQGPPPLIAPAAVELTPIRTISRVEQRVRLSRAGHEGIPVRYDIDCYRMIYRVRLANGDEEIASGLLALPHGAQARTLISYQHGTTATRDHVPSTLKVAGGEALMALAGAGYALIAPDYLGLGVSEIRHPYMIADEQARAVVSMIEAARKIPGVPNGPVFLTGHSEGGHASIAAMRMLEASGEEVLGAAPVAGAYDLRSVSLGVAMRGSSPTDSFYLAYVSWAYASHYDHPLDSILAPEYARSVEAMFADADHRALPDNPGEMFNATFLQAFAANRPHWFLDALSENGVLGWTPRAPVRFYYGNADTEVSPEESRNAAERMRARGGDADAIDVGPLEHDPSLAVAIPRILAWIRSLEAAQAE